MVTKKEVPLVIRAAKGEIVPRVPVWLMRQAGRYLPEFKEIFNKHSFFDICKDPELCCELTLQPVQRFDLDAAIIFSDILVIPQALGMKCTLKPGIGPCFESPLKSAEDLKTLDEFSVKNLQHVYDAVALTSKKLDSRVPLIGFSGGPWTLLSYMVDGVTSKTYSKSKRWLYNPEDYNINHLFDILRSAVVQHLYQQITHGCEIVQIFESNSDVLSPEMFRRVLIPQLQRIISELRKHLQSNNYDDVPIILFCKGATHSLSYQDKSGADVIALDWTCDPQLAREFLSKSFQGNLDPCALYGSKEQIRGLVKQMLLRSGCRKMIANLGHGIYPDTDPEKVKCFVDAVHELSEELLGSNNEELSGLYT